MPESTPVLSAAQHAIHNLKEYHAGNMPFPGEALNILERFVSAVNNVPSSLWPNGCDTTGPKALRYLAAKPRPSGGEDRYNSEHLLQIADELERAAKKTLPAMPGVVTVGDQLEALLAKVTDADLFDILKTAGRADELDFRMPGTSRSHKVTCAILEETDMLKARRLLVAKAK